MDTISYISESNEDRCRNESRKIQRSMRCRMEASRAIERNHELRKLNLTRDELARFFKP